MRINVKMFKAKTILFQKLAQAAYFTFRNQYIKAFTLRLTEDRLKSETK